MSVKPPVKPPVEPPNEPKKKKKDKGIGNPGNLKDVGKAGEKEDKGMDELGGQGAKGRSTTNPNYEDEKKKKKKKDTQGSLSRYQVS